MKLRVSTDLQQLARDQELLQAIKAQLPQLESLLLVFRSDYEDRLYRLYHRSFKVYSLQAPRLKPRSFSGTLARLLVGNSARGSRKSIADGTGFEFAIEHNRDWLHRTRPIVDAFLHAKYFLEMMIK